MNESGKQKKLNGNAALTYGQGKNFKVGGSIVRVDENQYKLELDLETPFENYRKSKFSVDTKRSPDQTSVTSDIQINVDGRQLSLATELQLLQTRSLIDLKLKTFEGKTTQIYLKNNIISDKTFDGEIKLSCETTDFLFEGNWNVNIDDVKDFLLKVNLNSPNLKINKIYVEAQNKPGKGDRKILITVKSAGKNLLTGSSTYNIREEQGKFIAEGSGTFKIKDESVNGNFKYVNQRLFAEKNHEEGVDISLDVNMGKETFDSKLKLTDKQFRLLNSYCNKAKECSKVEINSKVKQSGKFFLSIQLLTKVF